MNRYTFRFALRLVLKTWICVSTTDYFMEDVEHNMNSLFPNVGFHPWEILYEHSKLHPTEPNCVGIYKMHPSTHLKYLLSTSVHHVCYEPHSPTQNVTIFWFQRTFLIPFHDSSQAATLPTSYPQANFISFSKQSTKFLVILKGQQVCSSRSFRPNWHRTLQMLPRYPNLAECSVSYKKRKGHHAHLPSPLHHTSFTDSCFRNKPRSNQCLT